MNSSNTLLSPSSYFILNKGLIKTIGIDSTLVLSELINTDESNKKKTKNGYFLTKLSNISKETTLSIFKIKSSINKIYKIKLIDVIVKDEENIQVKILHPNILSHLELNTNKISIKKNKQKDHLPIKNKRFKKPSIKELKKYFLELGGLDESSAMFDYYESKGWKVGKAPMKCWKSATRNWVRRLNRNTEFPDYYDKKIEINLSSDQTTLTKYHNHLKKIGWESIYSPTAGTTWRKKNK